MIIKYSRHAKRRMKLYQITENNISEVISCGSLKATNSGNNWKLFQPHNFRFPLKVVYREEENCIIIVTCYPLKGALKNENEL